MEGFNCRTNRDVVVAAAGAAAAEWNEGAHRELGLGAVVKNGGQNSSGLSLVMPQQSAEARMADDLLIRLERIVGAVPCAC